MYKHRATVAAIVLLSCVGVSADTLVLRDGRRLRGVLVSVSGSEIEFEEEARGRRTVRIRRREVERIEFDDDDFGRSSFDSGGIPRGMRERVVGIAAAEPWIDTGVDVRAGQELYFEASGQVRWGPSRRDGPAGERSSPYNGGRPIPNRPAAALIGKVGDRDDYFFIGDEAGPFRARSSGRLFLGVNDDVLTDNSGSFRVVIHY